MVRLQGISKSFESKTVLDDFSLEIEPGERFVLLGRSGCGKTTLLRLIAGFESPDKGSIHIEGQDVLNLPVEQRPIGFIFQRHALFPHMNVYDNIAVGPRVRGMAEKEIAARIGELLEITHLKGLERAWPNRLSGGESQRVALARAIINRPKLLLLDEPLSALDPTLRQSLREELIEMQQAFAITFLFVTHDQEEAMTLADRMTILEAGKVQQVGSPETLYHLPATPFVAGFLGDINRLDGEVHNASEEETVITVPAVGQLRVRARGSVKTGDKVQCLIRPEALNVESADTKSGSGNFLMGTVEAQQFFGNRRRYRVRLGNGALIYTQTAEPLFRFSSGNPVRVDCDPKNILIFQNPHSN